MGRNISTLLVFPRLPDFHLSRLIVIRDRITDYSRLIEKFDIEKFDNQHSRKRLIKIRDYLRVNKKFDYSQIENSIIRISKIRLFAISRKKGP